MTSRLQLDIPLLLPEVRDASDLCVRRLTDELEGREGVEEAHVIAGTEDAPARLCVHYNPETLSLARIRELVEASGAEISGRYGHLLWRVSGLGHVRRARTVRDRLAALDGVIEAEATAAGGVRVEYLRERIDADRLAAVLEGLGVRRLDGDTSPHDHELHDHDHDHGGRDHDHGPDRERRHHGHGHSHGHDHAHADFLGPNTELIFALGCGGALAAGFLVQTLISAAPSWLPMAFYVAAYGLGGFFTGREAIDNLRNRKFAIDSLMLVAAAGAAALGAWAEGALLLFLFSLGHALEHYAMGRARRAIEALGALAPRTATVRRGGATVEVAVEALQVGDRVVVRPNQRLAADGFVLSGESAVDEAPLTGESTPVDKRAVADESRARARPETVGPESRIFAGSVNGPGLLEVEVTRRSTDTALARVVRMVSEAETRKSPTQGFTDRFERVFVPVVLATAGLLLFAWTVVDEPFRDSFYRAMAFLVAASPCALAIATPSAVLSGVARAARSGVLIKGGAPLERLGAVRAMAFDKTGTLTEGRPRITDLAPAPGVSEAELLRAAVAVEALSDHPLAAAIVKDGRARLGDEAAAEASGLRSLTGQGVTAVLDGQPVWIGKAGLFGQAAPALDDATRTALERLREAGRTAMAVRMGERDLGAIGLLDTPRPSARAALDRLRALGVERLIMISGDHQKAADAVAAEVGLDEARGDLMPEDKADIIRALRADGGVAMVGDGVNDAPAMAHADIGVAMGAAGSDVALETADVALMADDLARLPFAVELSRRTRAIIRQNLIVSLGVVALLAPATILGLGIGPAVALHEGSTLIVVFNALRLLGLRERKAAA